MDFTKYTVRFKKNSQHIDIAVSANGIAHAQAQSMDIRRALKADNFSISYEETPDTQLSTLFRRLAFNDFRYEECESWQESFSNGVPVIYALKSRYFVRPMILDYLEINKDGFVKPSCGNRKCVNPYHNSYKKMKASKLTDADVNLVLVFASQGVPVKEIAKALKVNRSTIYRTLNREHLHLRSACN